MIMSELDPSLQILSKVNIDTISHEELKDLTGEVLNEVLDNDSVLGDLPNNVTLGEVDLQIAVEHGRAITLYLERFDGIVLPIVVSTPVLYIKMSFKYMFTLKFIFVIFKISILYLIVLGTKNRSKSNRFKKKH